MELTQEEKMMLAAKQQMILRKALHEDKYSTDIVPLYVDDTDGELDYDAIAEEANDNLVHSIIEANGEIRELRELLTRSYEQLMLLGCDSNFTNDEIRKLTNDIAEYLRDIE